jgi:hypothetical protein
MNNLIAIVAVLVVALMTTTPVLVLGFDGSRSGTSNGGTGGAVTPGHPHLRLASLSAGEEQMLMRCATILRSPAFDPELVPLCKLVARL